MAHSEETKDMVICKIIWIPESRVSRTFLLVESKILGFGIQNSAPGIWNPANDWNPESNFHWQGIGIQHLEPGIQSEEFRIRQGARYSKCEFKIIGNRVTWFLESQEPGGFVLFLLSCSLFQICVISVWYYPQTTGKTAFTSIIYRTLLSSKTLNS